MNTPAPGKAPPLLTHLLTLSALAIAQPLFDILGKHSQFFITSNSSAADIIGLALVAGFVPGLLLCLCAWAAGKLSRQLGVFCRIIFASLLLLLIAAQVLNQIGVTSPPLFYALAMALALGAILLIMRLQALRAFLDILSIAILLVPALFLYSTLAQGPWSELRSGGSAAVQAIGKPAPVFFILIDEVPTSSLQLPDGSLDAGRFPNFARLAATSSWYRNATTVADSTEVAVPALLTGVRPDPEEKNPTASASKHPRNLFTALGAHYQINALEPITALCPPSLCASSRRLQESRGSKFATLLQDSSLIYAHLLLPEAQRTLLPSVNQLWSGFFNKAKDTRMRQSREQPRYQLLSLLKQAQHDSLNFVHIYLPHVPWKYLPSGKQYVNKPRDFRIEGFDPESPVNRWLDDPSAIGLAYQRHLLQLAYVDTYLGRLMRRIQQRGLWDDSLFILVADHGLSFKAGEPRRWVSEANLEDIAPVPLFIKFPGQKLGQVDDSNVESIDLLPTVFDVLGIASDWDFDGRALRQSNTGPGGPEKRLVVKNRSKKRPFVELIVPADLLASSRTPLFRQTTLGPLEETRGRFDVSTDKSLPGRHTDTFRVAASSNRAQIRNLDALREYSQGRQRLLPVYLRGKLAQDLNTGEQLVFALNGTIRAVNGTFRTDPPGRFAAILPEEFLKTSGNELQLYIFDPAQPGNLQQVDIDTAPSP